MPTNKHLHYSAIVFDLDVSEQCRIGEVALAAWANIIPVVGLVPASPASPAGVVRMLEGCHRKHDVVDVDV